MKDVIKNKPLISVIITAYNHARYLPEAIESIRIQTFTDFEIIVVDDGSTDHTKEVAANYADIRYVYQDNQGLPAARNTGIKNSRGRYIVFLDADDMLYPHALTTNLKYFNAHPDCGFVCGWHDRMNDKKEIIFSYDTIPPLKDHFLVLLNHNFIGMHATVMYQKEVFNHFLYDESLHACEDHDMYLRIAKKYPVFSHSENVAAYRFHNGNMSGDIQLMLTEALKVLKKNRDDTYAPDARAFYLAGRKYYKYYYAGIALKKIEATGFSKATDLSFYEIKLVAGTFPKGLMLYGLKAVNRKTKTIFKKVLPFKSRINDWTGSSITRNIPVGKVKRGDLRRTQPFSRTFGYDRGGPVDRVYIEHFLHSHAQQIRGNILEIGDNFYTKAFGGDRIEKSDILFIDDSNKKATIIGDLSHADHIPDAQFDCIVLTQTLHLIYDFEAAIRHCQRILKKTGTLLLTVPGITQIDYGEWHDTWYWSFTGKSIQQLLIQYFRPMDVQVQTYGNVLAATSFLFGMGKDEIKREKLMQNDPHYQVIVAAAAVKN